MASFEWMFSECEIGPNGKSWNEMTIKGAALMKVGPSGPPSAGMQLQLLVAKHFPISMI